MGRSSASDPGRSGADDASGTDAAAGPEGAPVPAGEFFDIGGGATFIGCAEFELELELDDFPCRGILVAGGTGELALAVGLGAGGKGDWPATASNLFS